MYMELYTEETYQVVNMCDWGDGEEGGIDADVDGGSEEEKLARYTRTHTLMRADTRTHATNKQ